MSDAANRKGKGPKAIIERAAPAGEAELEWAPEETEYAEATAAPHEPAVTAHATVSFFRRIGDRILDFSEENPHTVFYSIVGLVLGVLVLLIGFWSTLVLAVFVFVGAVFGQVRDGKNGVVNFFINLIEGNGNNR